MRLCTLLPRFYHTPISLSNRKGGFAITMQSNISNFLIKKPAPSTPQSGELNKPPNSEPPQKSNDQNPVSPPKPATQMLLGGKESISKEAEKLISNLKDESWKALLKNEFTKPYFNRLAKFLLSEQEKKIKVVILGQDPYHGAGQAMGMAFSVPLGVSPPPSLRNIFSELQTDLGMEKFRVPNHGNLEKWAKQGVFLLNTLLTVEANQAFSHQGKGWEEFTDAVIRIINDKKSGVVFLLWGSPAQKKGALVSSKKHHILKAAHPSPLAANKGFFGCKHFSKTNQLLEKQGGKPIDWQLDPLVNAAQAQGFVVAASTATPAPASGGLKREAEEVDDAAEAVEVQKKAKT